MSPAASNDADRKLKLCLKIETMFQDLDFEKLENLKEIEIVKLKN